MFYQPLVFILLLWLGLGAKAEAQPILRIVVPYAAGSVQDVMARVFSDELGRRLGETAVVENRSGAGGTIGAALVARSLPNGLTLLVAGSSHHFANHLYPKLSYDPVKDFVGVSQLGSSAYVITAPANLHVANLAEFVKALRESPAKYFYASAGNGSASHMGMAYFKSHTGLQMTHIPMHSTAAALTEVLAARSQGLMAALPAVIGYRDDPRIKLLAYTGSKRSQFLPELPTVAEAGFPGFQFDSWLGLLAPAGTPKATINRINHALVLTLSEPTIQARLTALGAEIMTAEPEEFQQMLQLDAIRVEAIVRASAASVD